MSMLCSIVSNIRIMFRQFVICNCHQQGKYLLVKSYIFLYNIFCVSLCTTVCTWILFIIQSVFDYAKVTILCVFSLQRTCQERSFSVPCKQAYQSCKMEIKCQRQERMLVFTGILQISFHMNAHQIPTYKVSSTK